MWIYPMTKTNAAETQKVMWQTFFQFGFPKRLRSDNGPPFASDAFILACKGDGIEQEWSSPYHSISNGFCERYVGLAKDMIKKAANLDDLQRMLQLFNSTPTSSSKSPAELLFSRRMRTNLPTLDSNFKPLTNDEIKEAIAIRTKKMQDRKVSYDKSAKDLPKLKVGQDVRIYNAITSQWDTKGRIVYCDQTCGRSYRVETQNGNLIWRNRRFLRLLTKSRSRGRNWRQPTTNRLAWEA
jgi:hypothetical protein